MASSLPPLSQRVGAGVAPKLPPHKRPVLSVENNLLLRERHLSPSLKAHYAKAPAGPLKLQHGSGQFLYDEAGEEYLDLVNNVCHVGHCHPRVVAAASVQLGKLNTNSRYLHDNIVRLSQELTATMPDALTTCFFVNSGSEANDLALRLARNHTARQDVYCVDGAYHGNSTATLAISPYSRYAPVEKPEGVVKLLQPDAYRLGLSGAATTGRALDEYDALLRSGRHPPAAYIVESIQSCGGQVFLPDGCAPLHTTLDATCRVHIRWCHVSSSTPPLVPHHKPSSHPISLDLPLWQILARHVRAHPSPWRREYLRRGADRIRPRGPLLLGL